MTRHGREGLALALLALGSHAWADPAAPRVPMQVTPVPGVSVEVTTEEWVLTAVTRSTMQSETMAKGPHGRPAYTDWNINPQFPYRTVAGGCGPGPVQTKVTVDYRFPRWQPASPPTERMREWWREELAALIEHEGGHGDLAVRAANAVQEALAAMTPEATCERLQARAMREAMRHIEHHRQLEREYDAREYQKHGDMGPRPD